MVTGLLALCPLHCCFLHYFIFCFHFCGKIFIISETENRRLVADEKAVLHKNIKAQNDAGNCGRHFNMLTLPPAENNTQLWHQPLAHVPWRHQHQVRTRTTTLGRFCAPGWHRALSSGSCLQVLLLVMVLKASVLKKKRHEEDENATMSAKCSYINHL